MNDWELLLLLLELPPLLLRHTMCNVSPDGPLLSSCIFLICLLVLIYEHLR